MTWRVRVAELVAAPAAERVATVWKIRPQLTRKMLDAMVDALEALPDEEARAALSLLEAGQLPERERTLTTLKRLVPAIVRGRYPHPVAFSALSLWRRLDRAAANGFLLSEVDLSKCGDEGLVALVDCLLGFETSPTLRNRLEAIAARGGRAALAAKAELEYRYPPVDKLRRLQEAWQANRTAENLERLYNMFNGKTKRDVLEVFGKPDTNAGSQIWYKPRPGVSLMFDFRRGKIESSGF